MADEVVRSRFEAETSGYDRAVEGAARATDRLADSADKAGKATEQMGTRGQQSAQKVEQAQKRATTAQDRSADAAGRLRVAQERLNAARESKDVGRIVAAEENVAKAQRDVERTAQEAAAAQDALQRGLAESGNEAQQSVGKFERLSAAVKDHRGDMETVGTSLIGIGAGLTAMSVGAGKAAMDWESAWAGVMKTNDGTSQQTQKLESELRKLTSVLPATHSEIAATAEAAGQLGVGIDDVAGFSEVMLNLGETTNLSADEAATALARFSNITGTSFADVDKLGSALVGLGNNFATTEGEILMMSERLAAAGTQAGMSEGEILGMATAMSSVGIEAEAGGTAITQTFNEIDAAVREGGESLAGWAELAGTSASEFAQVWENEPARAMEMVVAGLARVDAEGGSVAGTLDELGISGIRQADVLRRLASASDLMGDAFAMGNEEFDRGAALAEEAAIRYETTEAKISIAWNNIKDAAITAGGAILPVVGGIAESIGDLAGWFSSLPEPVVGSLTALSGVAGVTALAAGGFITLAPRVMDTVSAVQQLRTAAPRTASVLGDLGKTAGIMAAAIGGLSILGSVHNHFLDATPSIEEFSQALVGAMNSAEAFNQIDWSPNDWSMGDDIDSLGAALDNINAGGLRGFGHAVNDAVKGISGWRSQNHEVEESVASLDKAMSSAFQGGALDEAANGFRQAVEQGKEFGLSIDEVAASFPEYLDGIRAMATEQNVTLSETELLQAAMGNLPPAMQAVKDASDQAAQQEQLTGALEEVGLAADGTVESLATYLDMLLEAGLAEMSARDAQSAYQESIDAVGDSVDQIIADHGSLGAALNDAKSDFDLTTEAGRLANGAFQDLASSGMDAATAMAENGASQEQVQAHLQGTYDSLIAAAGQFGITGEEADTLARSVMGIPEGKDIETWMSDEARAKAEETKEAVRSIPDQATIDAWMSDAAFVEALATRAAVLGIPEEDVISSFMSDAARDEAGKTTAQVLGIPEGASISSWMSSNARDEAQNTDYWLKVIDGRTTSSSHTHTTYNRLINQTFGSTGVNSAASSYGVLRPGGYTGGRVGTDFGLPKLAGGGRLPYYGLGTDTILGIGSHGRPTALVDDGEFVEPEAMTRKYLGVLEAIRVDHPSVRHLAGYAGGGVVDRGREWSGSAVAPAVNVAAPSYTGPSASDLAAAVASQLPAALDGMKVVMDSRATVGALKDSRAGRGNS